MVEFVTCSPELDTMERSTYTDWMKPAGSVALRWLSTRGKSNGAAAMKLADVSSILCVELSRLGDVITIIPALSALKKHLPNASISVAVDHRHSPLFRFLPVVDEVTGVRESTNPRQLSGSVRSLRKRRYDLVLSMSPSYRNGFVASAIQANARAGYFEGVNSHTPFLSQTDVQVYGIQSVKRETYGRENIYNRSVKILRCLGIQDFETLPSLSIPPEQLDGYREKLKHVAPLLDCQYVVIHPFGGWRYRWWDQTHTAHLIRMLLSNDSHVVLLGEQEEEGDGRRIRLMVGDDSRLTQAFKLAIDETAALLKCASLFVGTDSGPLHLAATLGTPIVGLYGPSTPQLTAPESAVNRYLYEQLECSPCTQQVCVRPSDNCMRLISPEAVFENIKRLLHASDGG